MWIYHRASYSTVQTQILSLQIDVGKQSCTVPATVLQWSGILRTQWEFMPNFRFCTCIGTKVHRSHSQLHQINPKVSFHSSNNIKEPCCTWNKNSQQYIFLGLHSVFNVKITSSVGQRFILQTRSIGSKQNCSKSALWSYADFPLLDYISRTTFQAFV